MGGHPLPPSLSLQLTSQDKAPTVVQRALEKHNVAEPWVQDYQLFQVLPGDRGEQGQLGAWAKGQLAGEDGRLTRVVLEPSRGEMQRVGLQGRKILMPPLGGIMRLS